MRCLLFGLALAVVTGCGSEDDSRQKNVYGIDNRTAVTTNTYPLRAVGRLSMGCTGTLVAIDLVLTAAHCVIDPESGKPYEEKYSFHPNYIGGKSKHKSTYTVEEYGETLITIRDWAILRLDKPLGKIYGWLSVQSATVSNAPAQIDLVGYSGDFKYGQTASIHKNCNIRHRNRINSLLHHDCDSARGSSGGPILAMHNGELRVFGVHIAEFRYGSKTRSYKKYGFFKSNMAVPSSTFFSTLKNMRR